MMRRPQEDLDRFAWKKEQKQQTVLLDGAWRKRKEGRKASQLAVRRAILKELREYHEEGVFMEIIQRPVFCAVAYACIFGLFSSVFPLALLADAYEEAPQDESLGAQESPQAAESNSQGTQGTSLAEFDKRLPPVLAGEMIGKGERRKRVWSTSGPVPVAEPPRPSEAPRPSELGSGGSSGEASGDIGVTESGSDLSIILDRRRDRRE